ncbi:hypothetical protein FRC07_002138 [Ceratobasidium sp. 392]|nr:hypothetical protein FRC07_002138 [Ceratobasidium sp. 392]
MILEGLDVWVTAGAVRRRLTEYARIPSIEGETFAINWDLVKRPKRARLGLACELSLDGIDVEWEDYLTPPDISAGERGFWDNQEDLAPLNDPRLNDLNTIKVTLTWFRGCRKVYYEKESESSGSEADKEGNENNVGNKPDSMRWVNKKIAQKGHGGSAELGPLLLKPPRAHCPTKGGKNKKKKKTKGYYYEYQKVDVPAPLTFIFHYAPKGKYCLLQKCNLTE